MYTYSCMGLGSREHTLACVDSHIHRYGLMGYARLGRLGSCAHLHTGACVCERTLDSGLRRTKRALTGQIWCCGELTIYLYF
jgi:hypothetical protein